MSDGRLRRLLFDAFALMAGVVLVLAFAPFHVAALGILAPALLFLLWQDASPVRAAWRGALFGAGLFGVGVSWVMISIHTFGNAPLPLAVVLTVLFVAVLVAFPTLLGYFVARLTPQRSATRLIVAAAGWVLLEWTRGWLFTGFPWLALGYSQTDTPLAGFAPLLGVYGVTAVMMLCAAALASLLCSAWRGRLIALFSVVVVAVVALWSQARDWSQPAGTPLRVVLLQGNVSQAVKWEPDYRMPTLDLYLELTRQHWGVDVIVWPETAVPVFYHQVEEPFVAPLRAEAAARGTDLLVGMPVLELESQRYFNTMMRIGAGEDAFYTKRHLVPFGEYLPFAALLQPVMDMINIPMSDFSAGEPQQELLMAGGHPVGISICYEDAFGEEVIVDLPQAAYLVNVSNDAWFGDSLAPHQHLQMARMRALETARWMLRGTNTGISAIIAPDGRIIAKARQFEVASVTGEIEPRTGATPYVRFGNAPVVVLATVALGLAVLVGRYSPTQRRKGAEDAE